MVNLSFSNIFPKNNNKNRGHINKLNNNLDNNERGASPLSLPGTPAIPIPEREYSEEEEAVLTKFIDSVLIKNVNSKPLFQQAEKKLLFAMYYLKPTQDKIKRRLQFMGMPKEEANLEKNYKNVLKRVATYRSRRRNRKTRKL